MSTITYNGLTTVEGEIDNLSITSRALLTRSGIVYAIQQTWTIRGIYVASTPTAIRTGIQAREAAFNEGGHDLVFTVGGITGHELSDSETLEGVKVLAPVSYPTSQGGEYATQRTWEVTLQGELTTGEDDELLDWREAITLTGGGARKVAIDVLFGPPVIQIVNQQTTHRGRQSGFAVGRSEYPTAPPPIWPTAENVAERVIGAESPRGKSGNRSEFRIDWQYQFLSAAPLAGVPTPQPS